MSDGQGGHVEEFVGFSPSNYGANGASDDRWIRNGDKSITRFLIDQRVKAGEPGVFVGRENLADHHDRCTTMGGIGFAEKKPP